MSRFPDEVRLLILIAINAIVILASIRFARRRGERDAIQIALDAMLLWYLTQYLSVTIPGLLGVLGAKSMIGTALIISTMMLAPWHGRLAHAQASTGETPMPRIVTMCSAVLIAVIGAVIWKSRIAPPNANDALTYHLPAAMQWLRTGRLGVFETWFFNPANTYSPLAGSTFLAWLIAPLGNDSLATFAQAPALVMIFLATMQLARAIGAKPGMSAIAALALCCSRPLIGQVASAGSKDDLFVVAFFGAAIVGLMNRRAWTIGIALGLLFACKYTTLMLLPILLLAKWNRREIFITLGCLLVLAGPWYLRTLLLTGNPIFPMFSMFVTTRSREMSKAFVHNPSAMPIAVMIALGIAWGIARIIARTRNRKRPPSLVMVGPVIGMAIFLIASPFPEARFIYSCYMLLFVACICAAPLLLAIAIATSFIPSALLNLAAPFIVIAVIAFLAIRFRVITIALGLVLLISVYVYWHAFIDARRENATIYWNKTYGSLGDAWEFARNSIDPWTTIAYANTSFVYPLMNGTREVVYIPVRSDVRTIADIGHLDGRIAGEDLVDRVIAKMNDGANEDAWLARMQANSIHYILIAKTNRDSPEMRFASANPHFSRIYDNDAASVFEIKW